jgi:hypothetical protein
LKRRLLRPAEVSVAASPGPDGWRRHRGDDDT